MKEKKKAAMPSPDVFKRFQLELLDEYVCEKRGYDPYDTSKDHSRDIWASKRKRA